MLLRTLTLGALLLTFLSTGASAQNASPRKGSGLLQITSPADGADVEPGETVNVDVSSPDGSTFVAVTVVGSQPLGISDPVSTLPARFSIIIPQDIEQRRYRLTAVGVTTSGTQTSTSIAIDVERADLPSSITPATREIIFQAEGETAQIDLIATSARGASYRVGQSSKVAYQSSDPAIATVDAEGTVKAVAEGEAEITATYGPPASGITATIPVSVPAALLLAMPRPFDFGSVAVGTPVMKQMTVTNSTSGSVTILAVGATGDYSQTNSCTSSALASGASCTINVTFAPTAAGIRAGAISVKSNKHIVPVSFVVTGTGISN